MNVGVPKETQARETRVAITPDSVKKLIKQGFRILIETGAGDFAGYPDSVFIKEGAEIVDAAKAFGADLVFKLNRPSSNEILKLKKGALLISLLEPYKADGTLEKIAEMGVSAIAMELIPRTSRAQSMDALSSQANVAGYRAVIEATAQYGRFFPMMMTAAGSAKPAKVAILGAGVAGLQAIGTARRMGAQVFAYDVRNEVKEQIQSLGAKFIDVHITEEGSGTGGYAKELSEESKRKQQEQLTEFLKKMDIIISTANIPGRKAPVLITEDAVAGMRAGSVIVDMAAANGGNCPLSEADKVVIKNGVKLVGTTNFPALMPADSSAFYSKNILNLLELITTANKESKSSELKLPLEDDIIDAALVTHQGAVRLKKK